MEALAAKADGLSNMHRWQLDFALGKAYGDLNDYWRAFQRLAAGNAGKRAHVNYDETSALALFDIIERVFMRELIAARSGHGDPSPLPIFVLGMPRSGTTLVEQILASHPQVFGVEADTGKGKKRFFACRAVVFCTGGFTHNVELRKNYLAAPVYGACAARSNEGEFIYIAGAVGAQLRNMNHAWMCPIVFETAMWRDPKLICTFSRGKLPDEVVAEFHRELNRQTADYEKTVETSEQAAHEAGNELR